MSRDQVKIFDTTLRDGEQSPGVALKVPEKLAIAEQLARLGVDYLEAGFPKSSASDFEAVETIARHVEGPIITALARCHPLDVEACARSLEPATKSRIHVFMATSPTHMRAKLRMSPEQVLEAVGRSVTAARQYVGDVEFSAEDATRSDPEFLVQVAKVAVEAGARTINLPDTVGYTMPEEYVRLISRIREGVGREDVVYSVHCHDDLGMAVANSLAGVMAGCRQLEVAVNGIGERAGNASLEEVVMALAARQDLYGVTTAINQQEIYRTSQLVSRLTGMPIQPNKAVVGKNAFRHESGIHQDGMLKDRRTYEILTPESVGYGSTVLVLGKHSGRHALRERLEWLGLSCSPEQLDHIQSRIKGLAEVKSDLNDRDLEALWRQAVGQDGDIEAGEVVSWHVSTGSQTRPLAQVTVRHHDQEVEDAGTGDGPVHALFQALARAYQLNRPELTGYHLMPVSPGEDGFASVHVEIQCDGVEAEGIGHASDVLEASVEALNQAMGFVQVKAESSHVS